MQESRKEGYPFAARYFIARDEYVLGQRITDSRTWSRCKVLFGKSIELDDKIGRVIYMSRG
jgi:hypothetical protein